MSHAPQYIILVLNKDHIIVACEFFNSPMNYSETKPYLIQNELHQGFGSQKKYNTLLASIVHVVSVVHSCMVFNIIHYTTAKMDIITMLSTRNQSYPLQCVHTECF